MKTKRLIFFLLGFYSLLGLPSAFAGVDYNPDSIIPLDYKNTKSFKFSDIYFGSHFGFNTQYTQKEHHFDTFDTTDKQLLSYRLGVDVFIPFASFFTFKMTNALEGMQLKRDYQYDENLEEVGDFNQTYDFQFFVHHQFLFDFFILRYLYIGTGLGVLWTFPSDTDTFFGTQMNIKSDSSVILEGLISIGTSLPLVMNKDKDSVVEFQMELSGIFPFMGNLVDTTVSDLNGISHSILYRTPTLSMNFSFLFKLL